MHAERADAGNLVDWLARYDLVVDCSDNFATKFAVNDAAVILGKPAVFASVYQYEGQLQVYLPREDWPCLRCLWPEAPRDGLVGNCAQAGVLGPVPAALGAMQAMQALKILLGLPVGERPGPARVRPARHALAHAEGGAQSGLRPLTARAAGGRDRPGRARTRVSPAWPPRARRA